MGFEIITKILDSAAEMWALFFILFLIEIVISIKRFFDRFIEDELMILNFKCCIRDERSFEIWKKH
ncbi:hypothetical protein BGC42_01465 [Pasteurella multocida]|nr:hypothetical protein BGC42_01465 [Pasteurella multocida]